MRCADLLLLAALLTCVRCGADGAPPVQPDDWAQWGRTARHTGAAPVVGQALQRKLADLTVDPHVAAETAEAGGALLVHYPVPLIGDADVFLMVKSGAYVPCQPPGSGRPFPCGPDAWDAQVWNLKRLRWQDGRLVESWSFASDWDPPPAPRRMQRWEPVFHPALAGDSVLVPAASGGLWRLDRNSGAVLGRVDPFAGDPSAFVASPVSVGDDGSAYYHALKLDLTPGAPGLDAWERDLLGAWLVKVSPQGATSIRSFLDLVPEAPAASDPCTTEFGPAQLPWPPHPLARPLAAPCGSQRPGLNVTPAVAADGTIYTVSRAHLNNRYAYLLALGPDLSLRWAASLRGRLQDGCGTSGMPPTGTPGGCRAGAPLGVDPATNEPPAGRVSDLATSSPVVTPDGSILYGVSTRYNFSRGHLLKFSASGEFQAAYGYGWDVTPAVFAHDGTWSAVIKDNRYPIGSYCGVPSVCPPASGGPYDLTVLSSQLTVEWRYTNPNGIEWCVNAPAVDAAGVVYANNEDGHLYAVGPGGLLRDRILLDRALGASYTPLSLDRQGRVYAQNYGRLFVVGR